jgi:hypothetical protein
MNKRKAEQIYLTKVLCDKEAFRTEDPKTQGNCVFNGMICRSVDGGQKGVISW